MCMYHLIFKKKKMMCRILPPSAISFFGLINILESLFSRRESKASFRNCVGKQSKKNGIERVHEPKFSTEGSTFTIYIFWRIQ